MSLKDVSLNQMKLYELKSGISVLINFFYALYVLNYYGECILLSSYGYMFCFFLFVFFENNKINNSV